MPVSIFFHIEHIYYLPQFLPIIKELRRRNCLCTCLFNSSISIDIIKQTTSSLSLTYEIYELEYHALEIYLSNKPDWIVFGNHFKHTENLPDATKTAMLYHGIGIKECYYDAELSEMDVRFVEGPYRADEILKRSPKANIVTTGFAKLDPVFNSNSPVKLPEKLNHNKKTLLYAPTFYPSTIENIPACWPAEFSDFNIIIKPHEFSLTNKKYEKQRIRIKEWAEFDNVYIASAEEFSLLPFMQCADVLISEASSALFEFAALDKPVVWCDFIKLRWSYKGLFHYRHKNRMDSEIMKYSHIAAHAKSYKHLLTVVKEELQKPKGHGSIRKKITEKLLGNTDGRASIRIVNHLLSSE